MVRPATKEDASRIAEIEIFTKRTAYRPIFQNDIVSFNEMQVLPLALDYCDRAGALDGVYVFDDGIVKGMMKWNCADPEVWELKELYVDVFFHGEGVGTALMQNFLKTASEHGAKRVYLLVLEKNAAARKFYEGQGYINTEERIEFEHTGVYLLKYAQTLG